MQGTCKIYSVEIMYGLSDIVIEELRKVFKNHSNIDEVIIFGSRAKGNYSEGSDIDLALKGNNISFHQLMDIHIQIEDLELLYKVDLVDYNKYAASPVAAHIDRIGKVFYKK